MIRRFLTIAATLLFSSMLWAIPVRLRPPQTIEVCSAGCQYTTIASALAGITDASASKRYTILVYPGDYPENLDAKSYVKIVGTDRDSVRITCGASCNIANSAMDVAAVTEAGVENLTVGGAVPILGKTGSSSASTFHVKGCILGIIDGTEGASGKSIDGIVDNGSTSAVRTWDVTNTLYRTTFDSVRIGKLGVYRGSGNSFEAIYAAGGTGNQIRLWSLSFSSGAGNGQIYENAPIATIVANSTGSLIAAVDLNTNGAISGTAQGAVIHVLNGDITITTSDATRNADVGCAFLHAVPANTAASEIDMSGTRCKIVAADANSGLVGIKVDADADHANWAVKWHSGRIELTGGATQRDIDNSETQAGFVLTISNVIRAGALAGAGFTYTIGSAPAAACSAKCNVGNLCTNNSPALCFCTGADTWTKVSGGGACP